MKPVCELIAGQMLPVIRALVAKKLLQMGFSQHECAKLLGTTQPAISYYKRGSRGAQTAFIKDKKILEMVDGLSRSIANGMPIDQQSLFFCEMCSYIRKSGLACQLHRDASLTTCSICINKIC
jgi:predicted transcriptional regulator